MPRYDGTGPQGQGPLTGRGQGQCTSTPAGSTRPVGFFQRLGLGLGRRGGRGGRAGRAGRGGRGGRGGGRRR
jgi:hypothetical protein